MATFNTNQVRQLFVAKALQSTLSNVGDIKAVGQDGSFYFIHKGLAGETRSDLIKTSSITYAKATKADKLARQPKAFAVALPSGGSVVADESYILGVNIKGYGSLGEDNTEYRNAEVIATTAMASSAPLFYATLAVNLAKNLKSEIVPVVNVFVKSTSGTGTVTTTYTKVEANSSISTLSALNIVAIVIEEAPQEGTVDFNSADAVDFNVFCRPVKDEPWGEVTATTTSSATIKNGKLTADLEIFCMGERGDRYRKVGWPNFVPTKYMVDPAQEYHFIDIHYAYQGSCEDIQKSEKYITIVVPKGGTGDEYTAVNAIIGAINIAAGTTILSTLS